ncbi:MAG: PIN domain-containing protein [Pseudomonadota bacterium]|nr:PIN domain-containing protein [Pseudomonadota bacterium]
MRAYEFDEMLAAVEAGEEIAITRHGRVIARVVEGMQLVPLDANASQHYAEIRAELERKGTTISSNDYWIAAQARALGAIAVTDKVSVFSRVSGRVIENWLA